MLNKSIGSGSSRVEVAGDMLEVNSVDENECHPWVQNFEDDIGAM
jgi:hypothetical protein